MLRDPREIVAVEIDVEHADRRRGALDRAELAASRLRQRNAARVDPDEADAGEGLVALENFVGDAREQSIDRGCVQHPDARGRPHGSTLLSASQGRIQGRLARSGRMLAWRVRWFRTSPRRCSATSISAAAITFSSSKLPAVADAMQPAQFFMIGVPGSDVLLRRPFSVCGLPGTFADGNAGAVQVLYRVYGRGTRLLASLGAGAPLHVLGPLGRGFTIPRGPRREDRPRRRRDRQCARSPPSSRTLRASGERATMIYGARSPDELPLLDWFRERCDAVTVTTDDGSARNARDS